MRKFIIISVSVLVSLAFLFFLLFFVFEENKLTETLRREVVEDDIVLVVNDTPVTERELGGYMREVSRDLFEENLSAKQIREHSIEQAIRTAIADDYFREKGITVSEEEVEEELFLYIGRHPSAETKEEYFELVAVEGFSRREIERRLLSDVRMKKLVEIMAKDIEITEEEALDYYKELEEREPEEGKVLKPLEEIEGLIKKNLAKARAREIIDDELDERREKAEVEILE